MFLQLAALQPSSHKELGFTTVSFSVRRNSPVFHLWTRCFVFVSFVPLFPPFQKLCNMWCLLGSAFSGGGWSASFSLLLLGAKRFTNVGTPSLLVVLIFVSLLRRGLATRFSISSPPPMSLPPSLRALLLFAVHRFCLSSVMSGHHCSEAGRIRFIWRSGTTPILEKTIRQCRGMENPPTFHVGSHQFRESLRELLRELWLPHCSSRETLFREWDFSFRQ